MAGTEVFYQCHLRHLKIMRKMKIMKNFYHALIIQMCMCPSPPPPPPTPIFFFFAPQNFFFACHHLAPKWRSLVAPGFLPSPPPPFHPFKMLALPFLMAIFTGLPNAWDSRISPHFTWISRFHAYMKISHAIFFFFACQRFVMYEGYPYYVPAMWKWLPKFLR